MGAIHPPQDSANCADHSRMRTTEEEKKAENDDATKKAEQANMMKLFVDAGDVAMQGLQHLPEPIQGRVRAVCC